MIQGKFDSEHLDSVDSASAPPRETLRVQNFAGLTDVTLELSRLNVLIGPQASGKSVCAKLVYYFRQVIWGLISYIASGDFDLSTAIEKEQQSFLRFFPPTNWMKGVFRVDYEFDRVAIYIMGNTADGTVQLNYSDYYGEKITNVELDVKSNFEQVMSPTYYGAISSRHEEMFRIDTNLNEESLLIPATRSFYATLQGNIFTLLAHGTNVDPFLVEFGRFYEQIKSLLFDYLPQHENNENIRRISPILQGNYFRETKRDYIVMADGRKVSLDVSSSGQQAALPIVLTLLYFSQINQRLTTVPYTFFIEEPEAHLFPAAQREMVHLLAAMGGFVDNSNNTTQMVLTTHSPYLLATLNNLMYAGRLAKEKPDRMDEILKALDDTSDVLIDPDLVRVYWMENGTARPIVDRETGLIEATLLDAVSDDTSRTFSALLDVEFGGE